jgi:hypothetical protein
MELAGYVVNAVVLEGRSVAEVAALIAKTGTFEPEYGRQVGTSGVPGPTAIRLRPFPPCRYKSPPRGTSVPQSERNAISSYDVGEHLRQE